MMAVMGRTERISLQAFGGDIPFPLEESAFEMQCPWSGLAGGGCQEAQKDKERKGCWEMDMESFGCQCFMENWVYGYFGRRIICF
jgi:hypothetical protein